MHWARGGRPDNSEAIADAMTWGAPAEFIDALRADDTEHLFAVSPSCWPTITAWLLIETQWRAGPGGAIGVGLIESFGAFYASAFKEVIVFTVILPVSTGMEPLKQAQPS